MIYLYGSLHDNSPLLVYAITNFFPFVLFDLTALLLTHSSFALLSTKNIILYTNLSHLSVCWLYWCNLKCVLIYFR